MELGHITKRASDIFWRSDLLLARLAVSVGSLTWGFTLTFLGYQFDRPAYAWLAKIASQSTWGCTFLLVGGFQFYRAFMGYGIATSSISTYVAALICWLWSAATFALMISLSPPPAINAGNVSLSLLALILFVRVMVEWNHPDSVQSRRK